MVLTKRVASYRVKILLNNVTMNLVFALIVSSSISGWVDVEWDNGNKNSYRFGKDAAFDVKVRQGI